MVSRCTQPGFGSYYNYGAKGITLCERWKSFKNFYEDMGEPPTARHSIDRIKGSLGYSKDNCRWATWKEQARNRSNNVIIEYEGQKLTLAGWADLKNIPYPVLWTRIVKYKWPLDRAFKEPSLRKPSIRTVIQFLKETPPMDMYVALQSILNRINDGTTEGKYSQNEKDMLRIVLENQSRLGESILILGALLKSILADEIAIQVMSTKDDSKH